MVKMDDRHEPMARSARFRDASAEQAVSQGECAISRDGLGSCVAPDREKLREILERMQGRTGSSAGDVHDPKLHSKLPESMDGVYMRSGSSAHDARNPELQSKLPDSMAASSFRTGSSLSDARNPALQTKLPDVMSDGVITDREGSMLRDRIESQLQQAPTLAKDMNAAQAVSRFLGVPERQLSSYEQRVGGQSYASVLRDLAGSLQNDGFDLANASSTIVDVITVVGTVAAGDWVFV